MQKGHLLSIYLFEVLTMNTQKKILPPVVPLVSIMTSHHAINLFRRGRRWRPPCPPFVKKRRRSGSTVQIWRSVWLGRCGQRLLRGATNDRSHPSNIEMKHHLYKVPNMCKSPRKKTWFSGGMRLILGRWDYKHNVATNVVTHLGNELDHHFYDHTLLWSMQPHPMVMKYLSCFPPVHA